MSDSDSSSLSVGSAPLSEWFAFRVRPRHEKLVALQLAQNSIRCLLPVSRQNRYWAKRLTVVELPIFAGFVFASVRRVGIEAVLATRGVIDVVRSGSAPCPLPQTEMDAIECVTKTAASLEKGPFLPGTERVVVLEGPLSGITGELLRKDGSEKLLLPVTLLQCSVQVEVSRYAFTAPEQPYGATAIKPCTADAF